MGLEGSPVFLTPTPFNTLLWRAVVMTELLAYPPPDRWDDWEEYDAQAWPEKLCSWSIS